MEKRVLFCIILYFFIFNIDTPSLAYSFGKDEVYRLRNNLKTYFLGYYTKVGKNEFVSYQGVLADVKDIIVKSKITDSKLNERFQKIDDFFQLTQWLNQQVKKYNLGVNIFINPQSKIVNCWLTEAISTVDSSKKIWGKEYTYKLIVMDRLSLHDYPYFATEGKDELDIVVKEDVIFCNKEAFTKKAKERWDLLLSRYYGKEIRTYNPSKSDRLRKRLLYLAWKDLFFRLMRGDNLDKTRELFLKEAEEKLVEIAIFHELGHMMADRQLSFEEDAKISEIIALLTELTYSSLPRESLNTLLSFAWKSPWQIYRYAGQFILSQFIQQMEKEKDKGNLNFNEFYLRRSDRLIDKQRAIYNLSDIQIKQIAQAIYNQLYKTPLPR
jgi:hypothetical protein